MKCSAVCTGCFDTAASGTVFDRQCAFFDRKDRTVSVSCVVLVHRDLMPIQIDGHRSVLIHRHFADVRCCIVAAEYDRLAVLRSIEGR